MTVLMLVNSVCRFPTLSLPCAKDIPVVMAASKKLLSLKYLFSVRQAISLISFQERLFALPQPDGAFNGLFRAQDV